MGKLIKLFEDFNNIEDFKKVRKSLIDGDYKSIKDLVKRSSEYFDRHSPPEVVENEYNITGISHKYKIPFGFTEQEMETLCYEYMDDEEIMKLILNKLIESNPILKIFQNYPYKKENVGHLIASVIGGVCSRMSVDDIEDYITKNTEIIKLEGEYPNNVYHFNREPEYNKLWNDLYKSGIMIGYFPSLKTLNKIKNQVGL